MGLVTTPATILKTYEYSETSKILRLLTRDHGLVSAIAKGARRPKSRFGGVLEPFTDGVATYYAKEGRELHTLSGFDLRRERQVLGRELVRYAGAGVITEITLRFAPSAPDLRLFRRLRASLDRLVGEEGDPERAILEETWRLIGCFGFAPHLERCSACNRALSPDGGIRFDLDAGGALCGECAARARGRHLRELSSQARVELGGLLNGRSSGSGLRTARAQRALLRDFIAYHISDARPLNSFRFLEERLG